MVLPVGLEPTTGGFSDLYSTELSYSSRIVEQVHAAMPHVHPTSPDEGPAGSLRWVVNLALVRIDSII